MTEDVDILMITHRRTRYAERSLDTLLAGCDERMRLWVWHNGTDRQTLDAVRARLGHPAVHAFHHSASNVGLTEPTNWLWSNATGAYVCKVDDDCLLPAGWADTLRRAHAAEPALGVLGCWRFHDEDFVPRLAGRKIARIGGGHRVLRNCWIEGSGYLMKRACVDRVGPLRDDWSFTRYCLEIARAGWINGWYVPFIRQEHMDDPRSPHSLLHTDADLHVHAPLSAQRTGVRTLAAWQRQLRRSARVVQAASTDPRTYLTWRKWPRGVVDSIVARMVR